MSTVSLDTHILTAMLMAGMVASMYLAGRIAERRGRSFTTWAGVAAIIGPLALPLVFLFPNLHRREGGAAL
jgi:MFS family permease